jgi:hypothetical protein
VRVELAIAAPFALGACGLTVVGTLTSDGGIASVDGSPTATEDASVNGDGAGPGLSSDANANADARETQAPVVGVRCETEVCDKDPCRKCPGQQAECKSGDPDCSQSSYLNCDDAVDCTGGEKCCVDVTTSASVAADCKAACNNGEEVLCDPLVPEPCPLGGTCLPAAKVALAGRFVCK